MADFSLSVSPDRWSQLDLENATEYLVHVGSSPLAERQISDTLAWVKTGVDDNTYNGVAWTQLDASKADAAIAATVARFRAADVPALWYVGEDSQPADLGVRLTAHGCRELDIGVGMAGDLTTLRLDGGSVPGAVIRRVHDEVDLALWSEVYSPEDAQRKALYASLGLGSAQPLRHFLGLLDGVPVATASIFLASRAAGLYHVEVVPSAQRRGLGTAIVQTALREARQAGYRMVVLGPTAESQHMYERLGFQLYQSSYRYFAV